MRAQDRGLLLGWDLPRDSMPMGFHQQAARGSTEQLGIYDRKEGHVLCVAPTGAGKGKSLAVPALLSHPGSAVVVDTKCELALVTAAYRRRIGQRVFIFNPFESFKEELLAKGFRPSSLNQFDTLSTNLDELPDDATTHAEWIAGPKPVSQQDPFWRDQAISFGAGLIAYHAVAHTFNFAFPPADRSMGGVWRTLNCDDLPYHIACILDAHGKKAGFPKFVHEQFVNYLQHDEKNVRTSVRSEATSFFRAFSTPKVQAATTTSDISLKDLVDGVPMTIYCVVPPEKLESHGALLRIILGLALSVMTRRTSTPDLPTLFLIDEMANLGPIVQVKQAVTLLRSYGVKCAMCLQSLSQLRGMWPNDFATIIENSTLLNFGNATLSAAKAVTEHLGDIDERALYSLPKDRLAIHVAGEPTVVARKIDYLEDPLFAGRFDDNPYYAGAISKALR